jgi:hypothetical protein
MFNETFRFFHEHSCTGCGRKEINAAKSKLYLIPLEQIRKAALALASNMDTTPKHQMIDTDSIFVRCDGTVRFDLVRLDDQDNEDEKWPEEYQPLTTAKATADCARTILTSWQRCMIPTYRKDTEKVVFLARDLDLLKGIVILGDKDKISRAIAEIRTTKIKTLGSKLRY